MIQIGCLAINNFNFGFSYSYFFASMFDVCKNITNEQEKKKIRSKHIYLYNQKIKDINGCLLRTDATHLYLHDNKLVSIDSIHIMKCLTHLYLQWNDIDNLDKLNDLPYLTHLYLGYNKISHLNGLRGMKNLCVLHIQYQRLPSGVLILDETTLADSSRSLKELNISGNGIISPKHLDTLTQLESLNLSHNLIINLKEACLVVHGMKNLKFLDIRNNPITKYCRYKEELIASLTNIEKINDTVITVQTKLFIHEMKRRKENRAKTNDFRRPKFSAETQRLAQHLPVEFREIVSQSTIHERKYYNSQAKSCIDKFVK